MTIEAPLRAPGILTLSNGAIAIGYLNHARCAVIDFDFGDAGTSFVVSVIDDAYEELVGPRGEDTPKPLHVTGWAPLPIEAYTLDACPIDTLGVVERADGTFHVGKILDSRTKAVTEIDLGGHRASFVFPINGNSTSDDAPVAWYPLDGQDAPL